MYTLALVSAVLQTPPEEGLTFTELLASLPTDLASLSVLGMLAASFALVIWAGRGKGKGGRAA